MKVIPIATPSGFSIFCDDVRTEVNGKHLYIGVYTGDMFIQPAFPAALPSFSVVIRYRERRGESKDDLKFVIFAPGNAEPVFTGGVSRAELDVVPKTDDPDVDDPMMELGLIATFVNFVIPEAGRIKVRAIRGDEEIRLGTLQIRLNPAFLKSEAAN
jgi:hypothetical protein